MEKFELPDDLKYNNGLIKDPVTYLKERDCISWLSLVGEEFAKMDVGISYEQVKDATPYSVNVVSDPPLKLNLDLAIQHVSALDSLPRPTLIACRTGARASAVAYMYSGLKLGFSPEEVISTAEKDSASFTQVEEYKDWVRTSINSLREKQDK